MLSLNQKSLILLIVLLIITPSQANISDSKSYQAKGVSTTINTGINGGDLADNLLKAYTTALIDIGAKKGANWIGDRYALNSYTGGIGSKNYWIHKGLHAGLGCATASAKGQDCASGAMGGAIGEIIGEGLLKNGVRDKETLLALSRIGAAFAAQAGGYDVNTADGTAKNAVKNNLEYSIEFGSLGALFDFGLKKDYDINRQQTDAMVADKLDEFGDKVTQEIPTILGAASVPVYFINPPAGAALSYLSIATGAAIDYNNSTWNNSTGNIAADLIGRRLPFTRPIRNAIEFGISESVTSTLND